MAAVEISTPRSKRQIVEERGVSIAANKGRRAARTREAERCRRKFLRFFPKGFADKKYFAWERDYKFEAHQKWKEVLGRDHISALIAAEAFEEVAAAAVRIESRTNLLFSFEKMALRDAIKSAEGPRLFSNGLFEWLYGRGDRKARFERWIACVEELPRRQTRVLTWPLVTVFGFIAEPTREIFLKPQVTRRAAEAYGFKFDYRSRPNWETYESLLDFAATIERDNEDLAPKDMIDLQSFIWVQGSDEYD